jgi:hypothetical protein
LTHGTNLITEKSNEIKQAREGAAPGVARNASPKPFIRTKSSREILDRSPERNKC